jgi:hypothetical protein
VVSTRTRAARTHPNRASDVVGGRQVVSRSSLLRVTKPCPRLGDVRIPGCRPPASRCRASSAVHDGGRTLGRDRPDSGRAGPGRLDGRVLVRADRARARRSCSQSRADIGSRPIRSGGGPVPGRDRASTDRRRRAARRGPPLAQQWRPCRAGAGSRGRVVRLAGCMVHWS